MVTVKGYKEALQSLWEGVCIVYVRKPLDNPDPDTGRTVFNEEVIAENVPCRLSFSSITETSPDSGAARVTQTVKLFLDPDVIVPAGSKIIVAQNGVTGTYSQSGEPALYTNHKEIPLKLFERWA